MLQWEIKIYFNNFNLKSIAMRKKKKTQKIIRKKKKQINHLIKLSLLYKMIYVYSKEINCNGVFFLLLG